MTPEVYTFHEPVAGKREADEVALIELWARSWRQHGWEPKVLSQSAIPDSPSNRKLISKLRKLPSRNKPGLDLWCYMRWLAVAEQGGGFMSDYDVINYGFEPRQAGKLTIYQRWVPSMVGGTRDEFLRAVRWFSNYRVSLLDKLRRIHCSDMLIIARHLNEIVQIETCREFGDDGWEVAQLVHYSNRSMKPSGFSPRHEHILQLRPIA